MEKKFKRSFKVWAFDASKQAIGALEAHFLNIAIAVLLNGQTSDEDKDPCVWYFISYLMDVTLAVILSYFTLMLLTKTAKRCGWQRLADPGNYRSFKPNASPTDASYNTWLVQLVSWMLIVAVVKLICGSLLYPLAPILASLGNSLFAPIQSDPKVELALVMVVIPGVFNALQFWIVDGFLKKTPKEEAEKSLLGTPSLGPSTDGSEGITNPISTMPGINLA